MFLAWSFTSFIAAVISSLLARKNALDGPKQPTTPVLGSILAFLVLSVTVSLTAWALLPSRMSFGPSIQTEAGEQQPVVAKMSNWRSFISWLMTLGGKTGSLISNADQLPGPGPSEAQQEQHLSPRVPISDMTVIHHPLRSPPRAPEIHYVKHSPHARRSSQSSPLTGSRLRGTSPLPSEAPPEVAKSPADASRSTLPMVIKPHHDDSKLESADSLMTVKADLLRPVTATETSASSSSSLATSIESSYTSAPMSRSPTQGLPELLPSPSQLPDAAIDSAGSAHEDSLPSIKSIGLGESPGAPKVSAFSTPNDPMAKVVIEMLLLGLQSTLADLARQNSTGTAQ